MTNEFDTFSKRALDDASPDLTSIRSRFWNGDADEDDVEDPAPDDDAPSVAPVAPVAPVSSVSSVALIRDPVLLCAHEPTRVWEDEWTAGSLS
jgi:hypothetical protein